MQFDLQKTQMMKAMPTQVNHLLHIKKYIKFLLKTNLLNVSIFRNVSGRHELKQ